MDPTLFHAICGSITYSAITCRINVTLAIHELSKHMVMLNTMHMAAAWQCVSYLLSMKDISITYEHGDTISIHSQVVVSSNVEYFVDMSFAEDLFTRISVSGYASHKNKGTITWGAKGQGKVALSSSDAELCTLAECMCECNWLCKLMHETHNDPAVRSSEHMLPASKVFEDN